ncbi:MAG: hypothetical protein LBT80_01265 [Lactobacillaceae bacterium]|jgi:hypothetical protein|nr:hypothetical protein [Lactobacillaceae bacterium]
MLSIEAQYKYRMSDVLLSIVLLVLLYFRKVAGVYGNTGIALVAGPLLVAGLIILFKKHTIRELIIWLSLLAFVTINFVLSQWANQLMLVIVLWSLRDFPFRSIMKVYFGAMVAQFVYGFLFHFIWNPTAYSVTQTRQVSIESGWVSQTRYDLGYGHPNAMHLNMFTMVGLYIYLRKQLTIVEYVILLAINHGLYLIGGSRTGMISLNALIILMMLEQYFGIRKQIAKIMSFAPAFCLAISLWGAANVANVGWLSSLDEVLQSRISLAHINLDLNPDSLMGKTVNAPNGMGIDMGWLASWETLGMIFTIGLVIFNIIVLQKLYKYGEYKLFVFLFVFCFYEMIENITTDPFTNVSLFFVLVVMQTSAKAKLAKSGQEVDYAK